MSTPLRFEFVKSATDVADLPPTRAEVAFLGRSNVGKSSLLNALAGRKRLAHVSKTPGRTQLLNLFALGDGATAMDLPGYGYAAVSGATRAGWQPMIEGYLLDREGLVKVLVLVDGEIGPTKLDVQMLDWLRHHGLPVEVIASKHDKVKSSRRGTRRREVATGTGVDASRIHWVSAAKGTGIEDLRRSIDGWLRDAAGTRGASAGGAAPTEAAPTGAERRKGSKGASFTPVQQNPDGTWPDEDEW